jgi:hypothetical protein
LLNIELTIGWLPFLALDERNTLGHCREEISEKFSDSTTQYVKGDRQSRGPGQPRRSGCPFQANVGPRVPKMKFGRRAKIGKIKPPFIPPRTCILPNLKKELAWGIWTVG